MVLLGSWTAVKGKDAYTSTPEFKYRNATKQTTSARNICKRDLVHNTGHSTDYSSWAHGVLRSIALRHCQNTWFHIHTPTSYYSLWPNNCEAHSLFCLYLLAKKERTSNKSIPSRSHLFHLLNYWKVEANATRNTQWEIQGCEFQRRTLNYWASWNHVTMIQRSSSPITSAPLLYGNEEEVRFDSPVRQFVV